MPGASLVLIGFMGTGKSSAGRALAARLQVPRFDTDELITAQFGMPIRHIFERFGEAEFRKAETAVLNSIGTERSVVVTGGGLVLREESRVRCASLGKIALLSGDDETIFRRISRRQTRPLLQTLDPRATVSELLAKRQPLYRALADFEIDTSRLTHTEVVDALLERWAPEARNRLSG